MREKGLTYIKKKFETLSNLQNDQTNFKISKISKMHQKLMKLPLAISKMVAICLKTSEIASKLLKFAQKKKSNAINL